MSLSDSDNDQFKPLTLSALDSFDEEHSNNTEESDPDFGRFKALFEKPEFEEEEAYEFKAMYDPEKEVEEIVFKPLVGSKKDASKEKVSENELKDAELHPPSEPAEPEAPEETLEEKGYQDGFEKGLKQGIEEGQKNGFEEGFKKGEAEGLEKGEQQGLLDGEQKGFEKGFKNGEENATRETREKAVEILNSLEESLNAADQTLDVLVEKYEVGIISLIQQIAEKVVMARLEIDDELVKQMILDAFKTLVQPEEVVLTVSSDDYEFIEMVKDEFFEQIDSLTNISVRSDSSIKRGGCKIETVTASVSADAQSRLDAIFEAVKTAGTGAA